MNNESFAKLMHARILPNRIAQIVACTLAFVILAHSTSFALGHTQGREVVLPEGTEFTVITTEEINGKNANEGDAVTFKVEDDVRVDGHVVIYRGAVAKGTIVNLEKSKRMGKGGKIGIKVESTTAIDGQKVKLRASKNQSGDDKTTTVVALTLLLSPLFLLKRGKNAKIKEGTHITVYTDEAKSIQVKD